MNQDYNLRPVWDELLEIFGEFRRVADAHGLRYYVTGGTALGAMRHKGFIPWDDDFDLIMPREDYIRLFTEYRHEFVQGFVAEDFHCGAHNRIGDLLPFGKIYMNRGDVLESLKINAGLKMDNGLSIDVIPVDGMPKSCLPFYFWYIRKRAWNLLIWKPSGMFKCVLRAFLGCFMRNFRHHQELLLDYERWLRKWPYDTSPAVEDMNAKWSRFRARRFTSASFGVPRVVSFDKTTVPVPREVESFLTAIFGDWQKLPPQWMQRPGHQ